jgi:magnesium-protoporphyrin O-methyltransferase
MPCDCSSIGLDEIFNERTARLDVRRFRRRGLPKRARRLLRAIARNEPLAGATSLEVGAGIGALSLTILERGAVRAATIDAAPAFAAAAEELAAERQLTDRLKVVVGDFAAHPELAEPADMVVLDRVICCYPGLEHLLRPAAERARRILALTYPRDRWWVRWAVGILNGLQRLFRRRFRMYHHPPAVVHRLLAERGFLPQVVGHTAFWEILVARREPTRTGRGNDGGKGGEGFTS